MPSYVELIREDVVHYNSCDTSSWPPYVARFAQSLRNELDDDGDKDLLAQLSMADDLNNDFLDGITDGERDHRLRAVFNIALADCARIQTVLETETVIDTLYPKESFLVILVRNAMLEAHEQLSALEDAPVVLPRHSSGQDIPLLSFVNKTFHAPLVMSVSQEMPVEEDGPELEEPLSDEDESCDAQPISFTPPTLSEFLKLDERPPTPEEEEEEGLLPPQFEAHFLAYPPSATPPAACHIPILCMADSEQLPILFTSLLYQRRVWNITDPLVGVQFSKYDTTIRLFVAWLEDDDHSSSGIGLPRARLGEISTPVILDLSSPSVVLMVSRLLCSLESYIRGIRDTASRSVDAVMGGTQSDPSLSWRMDTDNIQEGSAPSLEDNKTRGMIIRWLKTQSCLASEDDVMETRQRRNKSSSAASSSTPRGSTSEQFSRPPPSSYTSQIKSSLVVNSENSRVQFQSQTSQACSKFAATGQDDYNVFRWMFDRRVVSQPIVNDVALRDEYSEMTALIWPETWNSRGDLPSIDPALEPCVEKLLDSITELKNRPGVVKCLPVKDFVNLQILQHSFSAIFQASRKSHEKTLEGLSEDVCEATWRHDHDRLLFDFFVRLLQPKEGHTLESLLDCYPIVKLEDPLSRPTLETTLRFPKSGDRQTISQQRALREILRKEARDLDEWLETREGPPLHIELGHGLHADTKWFSWMAVTSMENKLDRISALHQAPSTGVCDALGRLRVELPNVSPAVVRGFQLAVRPGKPPVAKKLQEVKPILTQASSEISGSAPLDATSSSMTKNDVNIIPIPYTIPSSSAPTSMLSIGDGKMVSSKDMDGLADKVEGLRLDKAEGTGTFLELPILAAEYKKAGENLIQGTNQLRMYLTAAVKFLETIGITNFPVYGVQTDGPIVVLPVAVLRDDNYIYLYERLTQKLDISTPVGAWHYATILCRLAQSHSNILKDKFEQVKDGLVASLQDGRSDEMRSWTMEHQLQGWKDAGLIPTKSKAKQPDK